MSLRKFISIATREQEGRRERRVSSSLRTFRGGRGYTASANQGKRNALSQVEEESEEEKKKKRRMKKREQMNSGERRNHSNGEERYREAKIGRLAVVGRDRKSSVRKAPRVFRKEEEKKKPW